MTDLENRIDHTVVAHSLREFMEAAPRIGHCFRCVVPVDPSFNEWSTFARIDSIVGSDVIVGGVLCADCVADWNEWKDRSPGTR